MSRCFDCANGYEGMHVCLDKMTSYQIQRYEEEQERKRVEANAAIRTIKATVIFDVVGPDFTGAYEKLNALKKIYLNPGVRLVEVTSMEGVK